MNNFIGYFHICKHDKNCSCGWNGCDHELVLFSKKSFNVNSSYIDYTCPNCGKTVQTSTITSSSTINHFMQLCFFLFALTISTASISQPQPCNRTKDSLTIKDLNFKLNRVRFYCKIVDKNPKQIKYLKGWVKRAVK